MPRFLFKAGMTVLCSLANGVPSSRHFAVSIATRTAAVHIEIPEVYSEVM